MTRETERSVSLYISCQSYNNFHILKLLSTIPFMDAIVFIFLTLLKSIYIMHPRVVSVSHATNASTTLVPFFKPFLHRLLHVCGGVERAHLSGWRLMSDQPPWDQNLERQIPGLHRAVSNLSAITRRSGFSVVRIILTPTQHSEDNRLAPTRIAFAYAAEQPATEAAAPRVGQWVEAPPAHELGRGPEPPRWGHTQGEGPQPPKRSSTSIVNEESETGIHIEKRKRFSNLPRTMTVGPSGAFWGTVLEDNPSLPQHPPSVERSPAPPPLVGPSQLPANLPRPRAGSELFRDVTRVGAETTQGSTSRAQRMATLPSLRLKSPVRQRSRPLLPSLQGPLFGTSTEIPRSQGASRMEQPSRQVSDRRFFRTASQFLGRISPLGLSSPSTMRTAHPSPPINVEASYPGIQRYGGAPQRPPSEFFSQAGTGNTLYTQNFPSMRFGQEQQGFSAAQQGTNLTPHSGSMSASGSGASYAQASRTTSSPPPESRREYPLGISTRGKRGRKGGVSAEREQFFECEFCNSKFRRKSDKNRHVRVVHEKSRPFVCPICEKTFGEKYVARRHFPKDISNVRRGHFINELLLSCSAILIVGQIC